MYDPHPPAGPVHPHRHLPRRTALCAAALLCVPIQAQGTQGEVIARYQGPDRAEIVSRDDLALELCRRFGRTEQGTAALQFAVDVALIRDAAVAAGVMPDADATRRWIEKLSAQLRGAGMNLRQLREQKGMSMAAFAEYAAVQLAQERLVRRALGLGADEPVTPAMLKLWIEEARAKHPVITEGDRLPAGAMARYGDRTLSALDLGRVLMRSIDPEVREQQTRQLILQRLLAHEAARHEIEVSAAEMAREVEQRRAEAEANPTYQGIAFDDLLASQGTSVEELRRSPVLRAQIQERKLLDRLAPDAVLERRLAEERDTVLREFGPRRQLQVIQLKDGASAGDAMARAATLRQSIVDGLPFEDAATKHSDDPYTRVSGGNAGWLHRDDSTLPAAVREAAFAAEPHELSAPIATAEGAYLFRVTGIEPTPNDATLKFRMRQQRALQLRGELLERARIEIVGGAGS